MAKVLPVEITAKSVDRLAAARPLRAAVLVADELAFMRTCGPLSLTQEVQLAVAWALIRDASRLEKSAAVEWLQGRLDEPGLNNRKTRGRSRG